MRVQGPKYACLETIRNIFLPCISNFQKISLALKNNKKLVKVVLIFKKKQQKENKEKKFCTQQMELVCSTTTYSSSPLSKKISCWKSRLKQQKRHLGIQIKTEFLTKKSNMSSLSVSHLKLIQRLIILWKEVLVQTWIFLKNSICLLETSFTLSITIIQLKDCLILSEKFALNRINKASFSPKIKVISSENKK